jgi:hypothetical protein
MGMTGTDGVKSFETLDVQVKALEGDVRDIKTSIASLGAEVRQALTNVTSQFASQQRTPWLTIGSVGALVITVLGFMGQQTLNPLQSDIKIVKEELVPRVEHNYREAAASARFSKLEEQSFPKDEAIFRYSVNDKRITQLEADFRVAQQHRNDDLTKTIDRLESENRELKRK